jgi:TolA-binding protein
MSKKLISFLTTLLTVLAVTTTTMAQQQRNVAAQRRNFQSQSATPQADAATVFRSARDLITDGEWARAQQKFSEYVSSFPNEKNLDAALYWLAYSQQKLERFDDCRKTITQLLEKYPQSSWRDDARVLLAQVPGAYVAASDELVAALRADAAQVNVAPVRA